MDDVIESVNNVEVADQQVDNVETVETDVTTVDTDSVDVIEGEESVNGEFADTIADDNVETQTLDRNSIYAQARREIEANKKAEIQSSVDKAYADLGMEWNGKPITTQAEYNNAVREQKIYEEAVKNNQDPKAAIEIETVKSKLASYEKETLNYKQDSALSSDKEFGEIYNGCKTSVKEMADNYNCDIETAFTLYLRENFVSMINNAKKSVEQETITKIKNNGSASPGSLSDTSRKEVVDINAMTSEEFKKYKESLYQRS